MESRCGHSLQSPSERVIERLGYYARDFPPARVPDLPAMKGSPSALLATPFPPPARGILIWSSMRPAHLLVGLAFVASPILAQTPARIVAPAALHAVLAPLTRDVVLPEGTEFSVVTVDEMSSKTANKDDATPMKTDEPVLIGNLVVIPKGAFVRASVADVKRAGHFGHAGTLSLKVESTTATDGQKIALRASKSSSGDSHMGATVALTVLFGPLGLLKHGNDVNYPAGTRVTVYTDQAITIKVPE